MGKVEKAAVANAQLWDRLYDGGAYLWYPYEVAVRVMKRHAATDGFNGTILDHGCGSGNHLEFFARSGWSAHGTEISATSINLIRNRFRGAMLPQPKLSLVDPAKPLELQLPAYDHAFVWGSIHYNDHKGTIADIQTVVDGLPGGGCFVLCVPSINDVVASQSEVLTDGSRRITSDVSGQCGAVVTVPRDREELLSWCRDIDVRDAGRFGWEIGGVTSEFHFVYGIRS